MGTQKTWATIVGIVLVLVGLLGFVMTSPLLGLFGINLLHNIVHLLTGVIFLIVAFASGGKIAKKGNQWLGIIYILVAIFGFMGFLEFLMVSSGMDYDNWLHLVVGVVSAAIGWFAKE